MITNMTIENAKNGDNLAFIECHRSVEGIIISSIKRTGLPLDDETRQAGYIACWEACINFDAKFGAKFSTYFYWRLRKELSDLIKKSSLPYITIANEDLENITNNTFETYKEDPAYNASERDKEITRMRIEGYRLHEISDKFSLSKERIRQISNKNINRFAL